MNLTDSYKEVWKHTKRITQQTFYWVERGWRNTITRLLLFLGFGYAAFEALPTHMEEQADPLLLMYIASVFTFAVLIMLIYTRKWNTIGQGLLATMMGDALLYARVSSGLYEYTFLQSHFFTNVTRSCFLVGATLLFIGLVQWVRADAEKDRNAVIPPTL